MDNPKFTLPKYRKRQQVIVAHIEGVIENIEMSSLGYFYLVRGAWWAEHEITPSRT